MSGSSDPWSKLKAVRSTCDWLDAAELVPQATRATAATITKANECRRILHSSQLCDSDDPRRDISTNIFRSIEKYSCRGRSQTGDRRDSPSKQEPAGPAEEAPGQR